MLKPRADQTVAAALRTVELYPASAYIATQEQQRLKASFWLAFKSNPIADVDSISPALVEQLTGKSVQSWLSNPAFWEWFKVKNEVVENLEVAAMRAAELAIHYLDPSVPMNDNARVALMKLVLEFSGRTPPARKEIKWLDKEVADLSPEQLDALIAKLSSQKKLP